VARLLGGAEGEGLATTIGNAALGFGFLALVFPLQPDAERQ
jgi:hypothetical protein